MTVYITRNLQSWPVTYVLYDKQLVLACVIVIVNLPISLSLHIIILHRFVSFIPSDIIHKVMYITYTHRRSIRSKL